ncbi:MAG: tripartite tricarboxylate transporter substrate binding protein [Desulfobacterales bacterium]|nr:tripartite tricarboxylate transporter substrate binding protein [Desulfobacterales bacterium]
MTEKTPENTKRLLCILFLAFLIVPAMTGGNAEAKFPSKTITYIIPVSPGGGFDTASRMLIPYLQKHLPGKPNIVVKNTPGGEWNIGINKMYRAKPDGHTVAILNLPGNAVNQVLGTAKFDLNQITWLGNISQVVYVTALSSKTKYKTIEALKKAPEITAGVVGLSSTAGLGTVIAAERIGIKMKPIPHVGSTEAILGAIRGDLDWVQYPISTLKRSIIDSNELIPLMVYSKKRHELLPDVPTVGELGYGDLLDIVSMYRPVGAPPGLPKDVADIWKKAFWDATNDPEFIAKMKKANRSPLPMTSEETAKMVQSAIVEVTKYKQLLLKYRQ